MILEVRRKATKAEAVRFTKGRGAVVKAQLLEHPEIENVKNGGAYLDVTIKGEKETIRLRAGDHVVFDKVEGPLVYTSDDFSKLFSVKG